MQTDTIQGLYVLKGDETLKRALKKEQKTNVFDYQKEHLDTALSFCSNFRNALDVGANYGIMSYHMSKRFAKVYAFEIQPAVCECLALNVNAFNLDNVEIHRYGLGETDSSVNLNFVENKTFSTHVDMSQEGNIPVKALDNLNLHDIDFIKIDAEGFEPFIIKGGINLIKKYKPVILYERKGHEARYGFDKNIVLEILKEYGYKELVRINNKNALIGVR